MFEKNPPTYTTDPLGTMALTKRSALGFHAVASPVVASSAAMRNRVCPPMIVKAPPAYTRPPLTASEYTRSLAPGFQDVTLPLTGSRAAMQERGWPPTL